MREGNDTFPMAERPEVTAVIGLQKGDESKGKLTDIEIEQRNIALLLRYNGGPNAGHTVQKDNIEVALHQLPSGVLYDHTKLYIASGCVVDLPGLQGEISEVEGKSGKNVQSRLGLSPQASLIQPHQVLNDRVTMWEIGTTGKGIGSCYSDQARRMDGKRRVDIRLGEFLDDPDDCFRMMEANLAVEIERTLARTDIPPTMLYKILLKTLELPKEQSPHSPTTQDCKVLIAMLPTVLMTKQRIALAQLRSNIDEDPQRIMKYYRQGMNILLEGAQAEGLDLIRGIPPYVTGSRVGVKAALDVTGLPHDSITRVWGVGKLIKSHVGNGPNPTEFGGTRSEQYCADDIHTREWEAADFGNDPAKLQHMMRAGDTFELGRAIRFRTGEYGVTSKRPRRLGAFDLMEIRSAADVNGVTDVCLSKLDCLQLFSETQEGTVPFANGYKLDGKQIDYVPSTEKRQRRIEAVYENHLRAFPDDITGIRTFDALPQEAKAIIRYLEEAIQRPIRYAGVGPRRDQIIPLNGKH